MPETRPTRLVLVTGTGTGVGKTWVAVRFVAALRDRGLRVAARKPAQSFETDEGPTDADLLGAACGVPAHEVCPPHRWYERAMAPFMAAEVLGRAPFGLGDLVAELTWPEGVDVGIVEGAGGPRSPIAGDGADTVDLAAAVAPDLVLLVADPGLGTINAVRLAAAPLDGVAPLLVVLNRFDAGDDLHRRNRDWLAERSGYRIALGADEAAALLVARPSGT